VPGQAAHGKASHFVVGLVRQHTTKHLFVVFKNNYFAVSHMTWRTAKLAVTAMADVTLLLCAEWQKDTRH